MSLSTRAAARRSTRAAAVAVVLAALVLAAACGDATGALGSRVLEQGPPSTATGTVDSAVVGQWFRLVYFADSATTGVSTSETTWEFRVDGTATRSVVSRSLASGVSSGVTTDALWGASGTTLSITLLPAGTTGTGSNTGTGSAVGNPPFGGASAIDTTGRTTVTFSYRVDSTTTAGTRTLFLDGLPFVFIGPPTKATSTTP